MNLIEAIPIGKKYRKTRQKIMSESHIDEKQFKQELANLRKQYIIIFDEGYYLPSSKEEYLNFIKKLNCQLGDITKTIELAYQEMEEK